MAIAKLYRDGVVVFVHDFRDRLNVSGLAGCDSDKCGDPISVCLDEPEAEGSRHGMDKEINLALDRADQPAQCVAHFLTAAQWSFRLASRPTAEPVDNEYSVAGLR
ncbi:hypothetical protein [Amycolatopsis sp. cmx-8-4]|uniref:hypothetical protein n=1 Tax=Amycolatopsis sp. cmx-8-4 TaxID=2790947 RepID=UPI00397B2524